MDVIAKFRAGFFDRRAVQRDMDRKSRRVLSRFGAFVRRRAKSSIRKRRRISEPGKPPSSHSGELRGMIFFAWDARTRSVVVGPASFNRPTGVPSLLEFGGVRPGVTVDGKPRVMVYRARPYMGPAELAERPKFAPLFRGL